jgi:hypothetical protein
VCRELERLLTAGDPEVAEVLARHAAALEAWIGQQFADLQTAVNAFDFELALNTLRQAMIDNPLSTAPEHPA